MAKGTCSEEGCGREVSARGICSMHFKRLKKAGLPLPPVKARVQSTCQVDEGGGPCGTAALGGRGMCKKHRKRWERHGDPRVRVRGMPLERRFWAKVSKQGPVPSRRPELGPCWPWTGQPSKRTGYATFAIGETPVLAHRFSYEISAGPIPRGYQIDHLCHPGDGSCPPATCLHRRCVNPAHLRAVPPVQNNARSMSPTAINRRKTHCIRDHEFTLENTYIDRKRNGRHCRECARMRRATPEYRARASAYRAAKAAPSSSN